MWQLIKENLDTKVKRCCGTYPSIKMGLEFAPEVLDFYLDDLKVGIDEKDDIIGDFMQMGGKVAVVCKGFQFYLTKQINDCSGHTVRDPSGCIRVGGKVVWKNGKDIRIAFVTSIVNPDEINIETLDGEHKSMKVPYTELKAA